MTETAADSTNAIHLRTGTKLAGSAARAAGRTLPQIEGIKAEAAVVTEHQVIVGAMLSQHPVDRTLLHPRPGQLPPAAHRSPASQRSCVPCWPTPGYLIEENFIRAEQQKLRLLAPHPVRTCPDPARWNVQQDQARRSSPRT